MADAGELASLSRGAASPQAVAHDIARTASALNAKPVRKTLRTAAISAFYTVLALLCGLAIANELRTGGGVGALLGALRSIQLQSVLVSLGCVAGVFATLLVMEQAALRRANAPRAARRRPFSALIANAISLGSGFGMLSGGALRARLYGRDGVDTPAAFYIASAVTLMSLLGGGLIAALCLIFMPGHILAGPYWRWLGVAALIVLAGLLVFAGRRGHTLTVFGRKLDFPAAPELALWIALGAVDWLFSAGALFALLPAQSSIAFPEFAALFTTSHFVAMPTGAPGGLGVFDAIMVSAAGADFPHGLLAALIVHRALSFLAPVALGLLGLAMLEARAGARRALQC